MASGGRCLHLAEVIKSDFLTCSICMNVYDKPKILPCLHTCCEKCLFGLITYRSSPPAKVTCPECRDVSDIPADGVHALRTCFFITGLIDLYQTKTAKDQVCSLCLETKKSNVPAVAHCIDCPDDLCSACSTGHCCSRLTTHHKVVGLEDLGLGKFDEDLRIRHKIFCSLHDKEELRYFCETCREPICRDCRLLIHFNHTCKSISDAVTAIVPVVMGCIEHLDTQLSAIVAQRQNLESKLQQLHDNREAVLVQVDTFTQRAISYLHVESEKAKSAVGEHFDTQEKPLLSELQDLRTRETLVESSVNFSSRILKNARDAEIVSLEHMLRTRLQRLLSQKPISSVEFHLDEWALHCRVCPETMFESLFDLLRVNPQRSPTPTAYARSQPAPHVTVHQTLPLSQNPSWVVERTAQLGLEDVVGSPAVHPYESTVTSHVKLEHVPYSQDHETRTCGQRSTWIVEKNIKLGLKDDVVKPHVAGMVLNNEDILFIADISNQKVKMSSSDGKFIKTVGELDGQVGLSGLATCGDQVLCASSSRICKISPEGKLVGGNVFNPRQTDCNHNISVYNSKYIAIAEGNLGTVSIYLTSGKLVRRLDLPSSADDSSPPRPVFVAFNKRGNLVVADWARKEVVILTLEGQEIGCFTFDQDYSPCCVCVDEKGRVFLSCFGSEKIFCLENENEDWRPVLTLGCKINPNCPLVITAGKEGRLYVSVGDGLLRIYRET